MSHSHGATTLTLGYVEPLTNTFWIFWQSISLTVGSALALNFHPCQSARELSDTCKLLIDMFLQFDNWIWLVAGQNISNFSADLDFSRERSWGPFGGGCPHPLVPLATPLTQHRLSSSCKWPICETLKTQVKLILNFARNYVINY